LLASINGINCYVMGEYFGWETTHNNVTAIIRHNMRISYGSLTFDYNSEGKN